MLTLIERAPGFGESVAILDAAGKHSYADLFDVSHQRAGALLAGADDLSGARVALMVEPGFEYVSWQWATWRAGGVTVPISLTHPAPEIEYLLEDATPEIVVASGKHLDTLHPLVADRPIRLVDSGDIGSGRGVLPDVESDRPAMILYTSGTTGRPKGVVSTHQGIEAQIESLVEAWEWSDRDRILLVLPLHHVHGLINVVGCALWSGAICEMLPRFDAEECWEHLASGNLTLFMAVPTLYHRLIAAWEQSSPEDQLRLSESCHGLRLMISGSAALPVPVLERWREISRHTLLERYGMTEIGMALSNPYQGERKPGWVGSPLPGVEARLIGEDGGLVPDGSPGEIQVRGPTVFTEYWQRPDATNEAFVDGWFQTGDIAISEQGRYRILGRESVDIIKTGAEKVSALEIEEVLLGHEAVSEAAVVGVPDEEWGEKVIAAVVLRDSDLAHSELTAWCKASLAPHKVPKEFHVVPELPRNAMGKVMKPEVARTLTEA